MFQDGLFDRRKLQFIVLSLGRGIFCKCNSLEVVVMKKIQAYKHVSHKTDSNKPYFILQIFAILAKNGLFCNF